MLPAITHSDDLEKGKEELATAATPIPSDCEVVDVTFGKQKVSDIEQLIKMS